MDDFRNQLILFSKELENEHDRAYDLWTWLPSYRDATEKYGQYAIDHMPPIADILNEACIYISAGLDVTNVEPAEAEEWFKVSDDG